MGSWIVLCLAINVLCGDVLCDFTAMQSPETSNASSTAKPKISWSSLMTRRSSYDEQSVETTTSTPRRSRFLGGLAFLAGLSAGSLANAASSATKTLARIPQASVTLNLGPPQLSPYFAAYYDPYAFIRHPYVYASGLGLYHYVHPSKLQSPTGENVQNVYQGQLPIQSLLPQLIPLFDNKRPTEATDNDEEEVYIEEQKGEKKEADGQSQVEDREKVTDDIDQNGPKIQSLSSVSNERQTTSGPVTCTTSRSAQKRRNQFKGAFKEQNFHDLQQEADDSGTLNFRADNGTLDPPENTTLFPVPPHGGNANQNQSQNQTTTPVSPISNANNTQNSTDVYNQTAYPPFFGYYGGNAQDISHIDLTTDPEAYRYPDYNQINYNLQYEKPAAFYPDDKYFYSNPPQNSYSPNLFIPPDQSPEYVHNDYNKYLYAPDNSPAFVNGFRPVL